MNSEINYTDKKVIIGLTGRVDSAVAAFLLKKQGMQVIGVSIVTTNMDGPKPKCHIESLNEVKEFCEKLKIPFYATDGKSQFESTVLDPHLSAKIAGRSNNSCFNCNTLRMNILYDKMKELDADYIATGHYSKVHKNLNSEEYFIHSNSDVDSDQSFLLSEISQEVMRHLILPLGELRSIEVDKIGRKFKLVNGKSNRDDKFCYTGRKGFSEYAELKAPKSLIKEGQVFNITNDNFLGDHEGMVHYGLTQSKLNFTAMTSGDKDLEIVEYDGRNGHIYLGPASCLTFRGGKFVHVKLNEGLDRSKPLRCFIKTKYEHEYIETHLFFKNNNCALMEFENDVYPMIRGEKFIIFDRNTRNAKVIGRGALSKAGRFELVDRVKSYRKKESNENENEEHTTISNTGFKF